MIFRLVREWTNVESQSVVSVLSTSVIGSGKPLGFSVTSPPRTFLRLVVQTPNSVVHDRQNECDTATTCGCRIESLHKSSALSRSPQCPAIEVSNISAEMHLRWRTTTRRTAWTSREINSMDAENEDSRRSRVHRLLSILDGEKLCGSTHGGPILTCITGHGRQRLSARPSTKTGCPTRRAYHRRAGHSQQT